MNSITASINKASEKQKTTDRIIGWKVLPEMHISAVVGVEVVLVLTSVL